MKRENCWMTFSEALESYLGAREQIPRSPYQVKCRDAEMKQAAEHMDALTGDEE